MKLDYINLSPSITNRESHFCVAGSARTSHGFTIVETLVAITILMIAVAGPLVIATRSLTSAGVAKNQMVATFLAQESIEVIKNRRDNDPQIGNVGSNDWLDVNNGTGNFNLMGCTLNNPCDASMLNSTYFVGCGDTSPVDSAVSCQLSFDSDEGYKSDGTGFPTPFFRRFYLEIVSTNEVRVHVIVDWLEGTIPYQTRITSNLVNVKR